MKTIKIATTILFAGFVFQQLATSQTNTDTAGMTNPPAMSADTNQPAMPPDAGTNAMQTATNAVEATNVVDTAVSMAATNETATTEQTSEATSAPETPPIVFQDVPLTTAIEALAREANINYLMDPKVGFGQPDEHGQIKVEPNISVRWENVTYQQALLALLDNYGLQMVENSKTKIDKITTKDESAPPQLITRVIQLKYAGTTNIATAVMSSLSDKRSRVLPDNRTSQLIVVATEDEQAAVDTLIDQLDKPTRQVLIETRIIELSSNPTTQKGLDWSSTLQSQNLYAGNYSTFIVPPTAPSTTTTSGGAVINTPGNPGLVSGLVNQTPNILGASSVKGFFQNPWFLNADGLHAVLSFLNASSDAQVLSTPRVVTL
ncbi:MAG TPA: secretin N-terminal domain-containing protein, partial [Phycisphaerae bacterium]|nr:secretin N-terminal domain-containing protein [Phycisphaerae bacterium]